jgi:hypothetical protein
MPFIDVGPGEVLDEATVQKDLDAGRAGLGRRAS